MDYFEGTGCSQRGGKKWIKGIGPFVWASAIHSSLRNPSISVTGTLILILENQVPVAQKWACPMRTEEMRV